jgi:hypothetical protein
MPLKIDPSQSSPIINDRKAPFPGNSADFVLSHGSWEFQYLSPSIPVKFLSFSSKTSHSLLTDMRVAGYQDGSIVFSASCRLTCKRTAENYFTKMGLPFDNFLSSVAAKTTSERMTLFKILSEDNTIPEEYFQLIEDLSKADNWSEVAPPKLNRRHIAPPWNESDDAAEAMLNMLSDGKDPEPPSNGTQNRLVDAVYSSLNYAMSFFKKA